MNRILILLLIFVFIPTFAACDSGEPGNGNGNGNGDGNGTENTECANGSMSATIDGSPFSAACVILDISEGFMTISGVENIGGSSGSGQEILTIGLVPAKTGNQTAGIATYAIVADPENIVVCTAVNIPGIPSTSVTIDAIDDTSASGTFSFTVLCPDDGREKTITNGQFDISN